MLKPLCSMPLGLPLKMGAPKQARSQDDAFCACQLGVRSITCVVDGDMLWCEGKKIRLFGIGTPEMDGRCDAERRIAQRVTQYLTDLLNAGLRRIVHGGQDRYGRKLARLCVTDGEVGLAMLGGWPSRTPSAHWTVTIVLLRSQATVTIHRAGFLRRAR